MSLQSELTELKEKIDSATTEKTKLEGRKELLMTQLKEKFNLSSIGKAEKLLAKMKQDLSDTKEKLQKGLDQFEEDYGEALNDF